MSCTNTLFSHFHVFLFLTILTKTVLLIIRAHFLITHRIRFPKILLHQTTKITQLTNVRPSNIIKKNIIPSLLILISNLHPKPNAMHRKTFYIHALRSMLSRCGGSLVSRRHVVTAGHCVARATPRQVHVTLGEYSNSCTVCKELGFKEQFTVTSQAITSLTQPWSRCLLTHLASDKSACILISSLPRKPIDLTLLFCN